jgi:ferredoxin
MSRPIWFVNLLKRFFPDRFAIARLTHYPIIGKLLDYSLFHEDDVIYLPNDKLISVNEDIGAPENSALPSQVLDHFIQTANHHWIMDFCLCREGDDCQDYPKELGCIFLGEAVRQINPKLGRLVSKSEALDHAKRCRAAGLVHMIGRNKIDTVWLGTSPGTKLLTICHCCPCCCLWKVLPNLSPEISERVTRMPGINFRVTEDCIGCGDCQAEICFVNAIQLVDDQAVITTACRGCGRCVEICPNGAIEMDLSDYNYVDEAIAQLSPLFDLT